MKYLIILAALILLRLTLYGLLKRLFLMLFARSGATRALAQAGQQALVQQPDRITLVHRDLHSWKADPAVPRFADPLFSKGFQEAGLFAIRELPGVMVRFLAKPSESILAVIYTHPRSPVWLDLCSYYQDGRSATFSTSPNHGLDPRPGHVTVHNPGASSATLHAQIVAERPKGVFKPFMPEDAVSLFERAWADGVAWRKQKGVSAAEVATVAEKRKLAS